MTDAAPQSGGSAERVAELRKTAKTRAMGAAALVVGFVMVAIGGLLGVGLGATREDEGLVLEEGADLMVIAPAALSGLLLLGALLLGATALSAARKAERLSGDALEERLADWQSEDS